MVSTDQAPSIKIEMIKIIKYILKRVCIFSSYIKRIVDLFESTNSRHVVKLELC